MDNNISTNDIQLKWKSARLAAFTGVIGCILFVFIDAFLVLIEELSTFNIVSIVILAVLASLFSLPFSIIGGYALGWLLQKTQWHKQGKTKTIVSGVIIASVTIGVIFVIGGFLQACVGSHGKCEEDFIAYTKQLIVNELSHNTLTAVGGVFVARFVKALVIAAIGGGITAWRLSEFPQKY